MPASKIAISMNLKLLAKLDALVKQLGFSSRSQAIQDAIQEKIARAEKTRLFEECAKLNPKAERKLAEEDLSGKDEWPEY